MDNVGLGRTGLTEFDWDLDTVVLGVVALGLGDVFLAVVGFGLLGTIAWSRKADSGFDFGALMVVVGMAVFFLLSAPAFVFFGLFCGVGFGRVGLKGF